MILYFLLVSINISFSYNYIKIPFERTYKEKITEKNYIDSLLNSQLTCKIPVGTPQQILPLNLKLNTYTTYISSSSIKEPESMIKFNELKSSSYKNKSDKIEYYDYQDFSHGIKSTDNFYLSENKNIYHEITFILATQLRNNETGILGLDTHFVRSINLGDINLIKQLKANKDINSYGLSFIFKEKDSCLILGGYTSEYDSQYSNDDLNIIPIEIDTNYAKWNIKAKKILYGNLILNTFNYGFLEPSINAIIGTEMFYKIIMDEFFKDFFNKNKCRNNIIETTILDFKSKFLFIYCDKDIDTEKFKKLIFIYDNFKYEFGVNELFKTFGDSIYFLVGFYYDNSKVIDKKWIFGEPFFAKYYSVIEKDKKIFGFYLKKKNTISFIDILFIIFIIFLLIVVIILSIFFYKNLSLCRKKRTNKHIENYDYIPNMEI